MRKSITAWEHGFKIHVPNMMSDIIAHISPDAGAQASMRVPMAIFKRYLLSIAKRCTEINDPILNKLMMEMALYEQGHPPHPDYKEYMDTVQEEAKRYREEASKVKHTDFLKPIKFTHILKRVSIWKPINNNIEEYCYKEWVEKPHEGEGTIIGQRTLQNGFSIWEDEVGSVFTPKEYIKAYLVVNDMNKKPFYILKSDE